MLLNSFPSFSSSASVPIPPCEITTLALPHFPSERLYYECFNTLSGSNKRSNFLPFPHDLPLFSHHPSSPFCLLYLPPLFSYLLSSSSSHRLPSFPFLFFSPPPPLYFVSELQIHWKVSSFSPFIFNHFTTALSAHISLLYLFFLIFSSPTPISVYICCSLFFQTGDYERVKSWLELASALRARLLQVRNHSVSENNWTQARVPAHYPQIIASWGTLTGDNNDFGEFGLPLWWKLSVRRSQNRDTQHGRKHDSRAQGSLIYARWERERLQWSCARIVAGFLRESEGRISTLTNFLIYVQALLLNECGGSQA